MNKLTIPEMFAYVHFFMIGKHPPQQEEVEEKLEKFWNSEIQKYSKILKILKFLDIIKQEINPKTKENKTCRMNGHHLHSQVKQTALNQYLERKNTVKEI